MLRLAEGPVQESFWRGGDAVDVADGEACTRRSALEVSHII